MLEKEMGGFQKCILVVFHSMDTIFKGDCPYNGTTSTSPAPKGKALKCKVSKPKEKCGEERESESEFL